MLTTLLTAHAEFIFWTGIVVETVGFVWFLFDSYRCDVDLARWALFFPPLAIYFAIRYPEECLKSFLVSVLGLVLITVGSMNSPSGTIMNPKLPASPESQVEQ